MASKVLHVGSGGVHVLGEHGFDQNEWEEVRLDINPSVQPDIVASMTNMYQVKSSSFDAVYSSHNIEHLYPHQVSVALSEFKRVLKPTGFALILCPDIQAVAELIVQNKLTQPAYHTGAGFPISPLDMLYGWGESLKKEQYHMAHHCGFTLDSLIHCCIEAGFGRATGERKALFGLSVLATKETVSGEILQQLYEKHA